MRHKMLSYLTNRLLFSALFLSISLQLFSNYNTGYQPEVFPQYGSSAEKQLIINASKGFFVKNDMLLSGLIASGSTNYQIPAKYSSKIQMVINRVKKARNSGLSRYRLARLILLKSSELLFQHYQSERTTLLDVLNSGTYNCVSSTFLYNYIADRFKYKTRAVVVPGHIYSQIMINNKWLDVETTSKNGFHPYRNKPVSINKTRVFIKDKGAGKIHLYIKNLQLTALIFYNRGTLALEADKPSAAVPLFYRALSIMPNHFESKENMLVGWVKWGRYLVNSLNFKQAIKTGLEAVKSHGKRNETATLLRFIYLKYSEYLADKNQFKKAVDTIKQFQQKNADLQPAETEKLLQSIYARRAQYYFKNRNFKMMFAVLNSIQNKWDTRFINSFRLNLITRTAVYYTAQRRYKEALQVFNKYYPFPDKNAAVRQNRQFLINKYLQYLMRNKQFQSAAKLLEQVLKSYPNAVLFKKNRSYLFQEWAKEVIKNSGSDPRKITDLLQKTKNQQLKTRILRQVVYQTQSMIQRKQYDKAIKLLDSISNAAGIKTLLKDTYTAAFQNNAIDCAARKQYFQAIRILKRGLRVAGPQQNLKKTLHTVYYNGAVYFINKNETGKAKKLLTSGLSDFPGDPELLKLQNYLRKR